MDTPREQRRGAILVPCFVLDIAIGVVMLGLGVVLFVAREAIAARHVRLRARSEPAGFWAGLGLVFGLAGTLWLVSVLL